MPDDTTTPDENTLAIPESWYAAVHPRRGGRIPAKIPEFVDPQREHRPQLQHQVAVTAAKVMAHPLTDKSAGYLFRDGHPFERAAIALAAQQASPLFAEEIWVRDSVEQLGLVGTASVVVRRMAYGVIPAQKANELIFLRTDEAEPGHVLVRRTKEMETDSSIHFDYGVPVNALLHLRVAISLADQLTYDEVVVELSELRQGIYAQRLMTSYLLPDLLGWARADLAELSDRYRGPWKVLLFCVLGRDRPRWWVSHDLDELVTAWDAPGDGEITFLFNSLDWCFSDRTARIRVLEVLSFVEGDQAFHGLLNRIEMADVATALFQSASRFPIRMAQFLTARPDDPFHEALLCQHLASHPQLDPTTYFKIKRVPDAAESKIPALLRTPPWTRPRPRSITISDPQGWPEIEWLDGEHEDWSQSFWGDHFAKRDWSGTDDLRDETPFFYTHGPADLVRPKLATWPAEDCSFYLQEPRLLVGKYELDALAPILRLARKKPVIGAPLLLPYRSLEVALLMAKWLATSRQYRETAQIWFHRHGVAAVKLLLPSALRAGSVEERWAATALNRLDSDVIREAGPELDCINEVETFLRIDPLSRIPAKVPTVPKWLHLEILPQVLLRGSKRALPSTAIEALCRMIAMSELDEPYEGLRVIAEACDTGSLATFAWALFSHWSLAERPSKDVWAMNALAYFGDDKVADRLAPMIRRWPSDGATARAKRGVDILAGMDGEQALQHLSSLRRNAKSTPLREHARIALDRVALDRGLLPEQLDDLLVPDLGLNDEPLVYRDISYRPELNTKLELTLRAADGTDRALLPKPGDEEEKSVVAGWNKQRKLAKATLSEQVRRLEEAMIVQRRWTSTDFRTAILAHPLLSRLARLLIWRTADGTAVVDQLGDLVDINGGLVPATDWVELAHPSTDDLAQWQAWITKNAVQQPFTQFGRDTYDEDPSSMWQRTVAAAS